MNRWKIAVLLGTALSIGGALIGYSLTSRKAEGAAAGAVTSGGVGTSIGDTAPEFELERVDGTSVSLGDLRGQSAVLVFWTAWCPICREEAPRINQLAEEFEPRGVRVLGINIKDSQARTEAGIMDFGIRYQVARDADASIARRYRVIGTPTIVFLDSGGIVRYFGNELPKDYPERLGALISSSW